MARAMISLCWGGGGGVVLEVPLAPQTQHLLCDNTVPPPTHGLPVVAQAENLGTPTPPGAGFFLPLSWPHKSLPLRRCGYSLALLLLLLAGLRSCNLFPCSQPTGDLPETQS